MTVRSESIWNRNFICAIIANFLLAMAHTSVNTLASTYAAFLGAEAVLVGALTSIFFGVSVAMRPIAGPLTTRLNNRTLMIVVYILGVLVHVGYTLFNGVGSFLFFRILNGIQYSIIGSLTMKTASDSLPVSKAASGIGVYCISNSAANALGPSAGVIARDLGTKAAGELFGFRCVFVFAAVMMILALIPVFCLNDPGKPKKLAGSVWYKEMFSPHALAPALALMLLMMSYSLFSAYMVPYAAKKGIPGISTFFLVHAMCLVGTRPLFGTLADKYGLMKITLPGALLFTIPLVIVARGETLAVMLLAGVLAAVTHGAVYPTLQAMCMKAELPEKSGVASNTVYLGIDLGYFLGPLVGSIVYSQTSYETMYASSVIPCFLAAAILVAFWPRIRRRHQLVADERNVSESI
ncbi:MAG: MFS transporter [Oscillospiraceae bacterium]|nr:MFS transporter [Oscillospiraceae bacterium]